MPKKADNTRKNRLAHVPGRQAGVLDRLERLLERYSSVGDKRGMADTQALIEQLKAKWGLKVNG